MAAAVNNFRRRFSHRADHLKQSPGIIGLVQLKLMSSSIAKSQAFRSCIGACRKSHASVYRTQLPRATRPLLVVPSATRSQDSKVRVAVDNDPDATELETRRLACQKSRVTCALALGLGRRAGIGAVAGLIPWAGKRGFHEALEAMGNGPLLLHASQAALGFSRS